MIIIASLVFITIFSTGCTQRIGECRSETFMDNNMRKIALEQHNWRRYFLAGGKPFPDKHHIDYPTASDMSVLYYDCDLEIAAYEIALPCESGRPNFNYVGANNGTWKLIGFNADKIDEIVNEWWETALAGGNLVNLTPSQQNTPMIPFLQMANGKTNRVGCAFEICGDREFEEYVLFVCAYGEQTIRVGNPIYTKGPPCGSCRGKCTFNGRLCDV